MRCAVTAPLQLLLATALVGAAQPPQADAAIVFQSGAEAYDAALSGIRELLGGAAYRIQYIDLTEPAARKKIDALTVSPPRLVVAVGIGAWDQLGNTPAPVLPSLILREDARAKDRPTAGAVYADVTLAAVAEGLRTMFPNRTRLALIHHSSRPAPDPQIVGRLKQMGFELVIVDCAGPDKLLAAFTSLKGKADFVIAEPDADLYNSATVKPLVLASLEAHLPIAGFSAAFVRAGALAGVYPDFHELGLETGEMIQRILEQKNPAEKKRGEDARKVILAVNERIARLIGIEPVEGARLVMFR